MKKPIVVLSLVSSSNPGEQWHFAALRLEKDLRPKYLFLSGSENRLGPPVRDNNISEIEEFLMDSFVFVYDQAALTQAYKLFGPSIKTLLFIDVKELILLLYPLQSHYGLPDICESLAVSKKTRYRSPAHLEVRLIWELLKICWLKGLEFDIGYLTRLEEYIKGLSCEPLIEELIKEISKQFPDRPLRTGLGSKETGTCFLAENAGEQSEEIPESAQWVINCFQKGGLLSQNLAGYEDRSIQSLMAQAILQSFSGSEDLIIEAGTGTGKSLAYLIPALWWAKRNKKRVVIATNTITLQEQLYYKDLPFLQKILPFGFKKALLKGKSNYLCLQSFYQDKGSEELSAKEKFVQAGIFCWLRETSAGDFSELSYLHNISMAWRKYGADNPYCQPAECQFARQCYLLKARKKAEDADLIVINHSLLLADIKTNNKILPEYTDLIIDEAHNMYQTALKQLGFEISLEHCLRLLDSIAGGKGSLFTVLKKNRSFWAEVYPALNWQEYNEILEMTPGLCKKAADHARELFGICEGVLGGRLTIRIHNSKIGERTFSVLRIAIENLIGSLSELTEKINKLNTFLSMESEQLEKVCLEILRKKSELIQVSEGLQAFLQEEEVTRVTYLEKSNVIYLKNTVIDIAKVLGEKIFSRNNSTVLTSATLTVAGSFEYFARDMGVETYESIKLDSPFNYNRQMLFCIVNNLPVQQASEDSMALKTAFFLKQAAEIMGGRTLVLFTSHRYLRLVHSLLEQELPGSDLKILAQGIDGTRDVLLKDFTRNKRSILLGTSSFWEGIDIPGDTLRCVIMTKLPFWPPDSPVLEARSQLLESQGYEPFHDLHLPEAIIRFKQGFGRLIRTKEDKGVVILLDDRILKKYYGKSFLKSLPILSYYQGSSEKVLDQISKWV